MSGSVQTTQRRSGVGNRAVGLAERRRAVMSAASLLPLGFFLRSSAGCSLFQEAFC